MTSEPAVSPRLTVVLPLKGRSLFTLRLLAHADAMRMPYRFLIADGQVNEPVARHLENSAETFPHLDVEYVRYSHDASYRDYFLKVADALARVRTPYAMLADNDDFLGPNGIAQAIDFLDANPDYVGARGQVATFSVYSGLGNPSGGVHGKLDRLSLGYECNDLSQPLAFERLRQGGQSHLIFYAVHRTDVLATVWREAAEIDFSDLMLHEIYHAMRPLTLGKVRADRAAITYFAQIGTSTSSNPMLDWAGHLLRSRLTGNIHDMVARIVGAATVGETDATAVDEQTRALVEDYFRDFLWSNYGLVARIKRLFRSISPAAVKYWQSRPRFSIGRDVADISKTLAAEGAPSRDLDRMRVEISAIQRVLSPETFAGFAGPFLAMARAGSGREWI